MPLKFFNSLSKFLKHSPIVEMTIKNDGENFLIKMTDSWGYKCEIVCSRDGDLNIASLKQD